MDMQEIEQRLERIKHLANIGDNKSAHHEEDKLLIDALKDIVACSLVSYEALAELVGAAERARKALEVTNLDYPKCYA